MIMEREYIRLISEW